MGTGAETLVFWGAGAAQSLGLRPTLDQADAIRKLVGGGVLAVTDRVDQILNSPSVWSAPLVDLLLVLGDDASDDIYCVALAAREAMSRHWGDRSPRALDTRIHELRALYDWPALKVAVQVCPGFNDGKRFQLSDVLNLIDLHAHSFHGFPGPKVFLPPTRLVAARRALQLIINTLFFIDWQTALTEKAGEINKHPGFARLLTEHHQQEGLRLAATRRHFDSREFYLGDVAFASLNYDPLALWMQFIANRDANFSPPYVDVPRQPLKIFHDFGIFMAVSSIDPQTGGAEGKERVWYPLNEASAQRLNDRDHSTRRVRINKFLFPHGCLCWRECPSCGKLSAYMGKEWDVFSRALIPPPPLRGFAKLAGITREAEAETEKEGDAWDRGAVDARICVHCREWTHAQHTQAVMQSNFKPLPPSFIDEVQRDLRVATQAARHIVLMGYSLPPDDVAYRAFFAARRQRYANNESAVHCSVVVGRDWCDRWHGPDRIDELLRDMEKDQSPRTTLEAARDLFGPDKVRFYGGGIPQVFCDGEVASSARVQALIEWNVT